MKKYNVQNYVRYKEDIKQSMPKNKPYSFYTRDELVIKFLGLVENISRKFATSQEASGVMSINDIIQEGSLNLTKAVDKIDWEKVAASDNIEQTLKSFLSKRIRGGYGRYMLTESVILLENVNYQTDLGKHFFTRLTLC